MIFLDGNIYICKTETNTYKYSINRYGKYAKRLAKLSEKYNKIFKNYIVIKEEYAIIKVYSKKFGYKDVYINKSDIDLVQKYKWAINDHKHTFYAFTNIRNINNGKKTPVRLHTILLNPPKGLEVDHIDTNGLNNRRNNIRLVEHKINARNRPNLMNKTNKKDNDLPIGIYRYNNGVEVGFTLLNFRHNKKFNFKNYSSEKKAIQAALKYRIAICKKIGYSENILNIMYSKVPINKLKVKKKNKYKKIKIKKR